MSYKEIDLVEDLIKKKEKEIISYSFDEKGLIPQIEKGAEWDKAKDELNMLNKIKGVLFTHEHMVENNKMDFGYVLSKLTSGTARIYYRVSDISKNRLILSIRDKLDGDDVIAELTLSFEDKECYLLIRQAPECGIKNVNIEANISTREDIERLHKLCDEVSKALNSEQTE